MRIAGWPKKEENEKNRFSVQLSTFSAAAENCISAEKVRKRRRRRNAKAAKMRKILALYFEEKRLPFQFNDLAAPSNCGAAMGEFFRECCTQYSIFLSSRNFKILGGSSLLDSIVYKWTWYSIFWVKLIFPRVSEFYSTYSTLKLQTFLNNIEFKGTQKLSTRLDIFKSFPDSILDSTRLDFCRGGVPISELAHGWHTRSRTTFSVIAMRSKTEV